MKTIHVRFDLRFPRRFRKGLLASALMAFCAPFIDSENAALSTYYPSPGGVYANMATTGQTLLAASAGCVGIGTTAPTHTLDVRGAGRLAVLTAYMSSSLAASMGNVGVGSTVPGLTLFAGGIRALTIKDNATQGIGIGTPNPAGPNNGFLLDVGDGTAAPGTIVAIQPGCVHVPRTIDCSGGTPHRTMQSGVYAEVELFIPNGSDVNNAEFICCP